MSAIGVVIIGRNEGERLKNCIRSLSNIDVKIVYVDSNSSDDSVDYVKQQGFDVVELDMSIPFSAARARNEGYRYLLSKYDDIDYLQFVDGDCEVCEGWISSAKQHLLSNLELASVCGRRKERFPERTLYNKLCDIEWNTPVGPARSTGGDFMCRKQALLDVDGFNPQVIAGEEPEMCFRMRQKGWSLERLDAEMTLHDANMTSLGQWWKRCERSGHAYAQGFFMHGNGAEKYCRADVMRILLWSLGVPVFIVFCAIVFSPWLLLLFLVFPLKIAQIAKTQVKYFGFGVGLAYSASLIFCKFPQLKGLMSFLFKQLTGRRFQIIEYKGTAD
ncbi:MAG: glycosyltransferase family 2 protein [Cellvibrionaceae bacterium]